MEPAKNDLATYVQKALGELQFTIITLVAERDSLSSQLHVTKMENEALKAKKEKPAKTPQ